MDEIIQRISSLSIPILFESCFRFIQDSDYLAKELNNNNEAATATSGKIASRKSPSKESSSPDVAKKTDDFSLTRSNWTVAPKLFASPPSRFGPSNPQSSTVFSFQKTSAYSMHTLDSLDSMDAFDFYENSKSSWPKPDPRPIGTKPASMSTTSNSSNPRNRYKHVAAKLNSNSACYVTQSNSNFKHNSPKFVLENCKTIWMDCESEKPPVDTSPYCYNNASESANKFDSMNKYQYSNSNRPENHHLRKSSFSNQVDNNNNATVPDLSYAQNRSIVVFVN